MSPPEYLKLPYTRRAMPDDGGYFAEIVEFPGCIAWALTEGEALKQLEEVAECWIEAAIEQGQDIPAVGV